MNKEDEVGNRLKAVRNLLKHTQKEVGEALGYQQGSYSNLELGKVELSTKTLQRFCSIYQVNPLYVLAGSLPVFREARKRLSHSEIHRMQMRAHQSNDMAELRDMVCQLLEELAHLHDELQAEDEKIKELVQLRSKHK